MKTSNIKLESLLILVVVFAVFLIACSGDRTYSSAPVPDNDNDIIQRPYKRAIMASQVTDINGHPLCRAWVASRYHDYRVDTLIILESAVTDDRGISCHCIYMTQKPLFDTVLSWVVFPGKEKLFCSDTAVSRISKNEDSLFLRFSIDTNSTPSR